MAKYLCPMMDDTNPDVINFKYISPDTPTNWAAIKGLPSAFPPSAHTHDILWSLIQGLPEEFKPESHTHEEYALVEHDHDEKYSETDHNHDEIYAEKEHDHEVAWSDITGKPRKFEPRSHTHPGSKILMTGYNEEESAVGILATDDLLEAVFKLDSCMKVKRIV